MIFGFAAMGLGPVIAESDTKNSAASCLPSVLFAKDRDKTKIATIRNEIARERSMQSSYYLGFERFLGSMSVAASRLCKAFDLYGLKRPEILVAASPAWRTVSRTITGGENEVIMLSREQTLLQTGSSSTDNMLFAILAHELAHAFQFNRYFDRDDRSVLAMDGGGRSLRDVELHADFMAGFALGRSEEPYGRPQDLLRRFSDTILALGDFNIRPCMHQGTPAERYTMMMKGYIEAQRSPDLTAEGASLIGNALMASALSGPFESQTWGAKCI